MKMIINNRKMSEAVDTFVDVVQLGVLVIVGCTLTFLALFLAILVSPFALLFALGRMGYEIYVHYRGRK